MTKLTKESRNKIIAILAGGALVIGGLGACTTGCVPGAIRSWAPLAAYDAASELVADSGEPAVKYVHADEVRALDIDWEAGSVVVRVADDSEMSGRVKLVERYAGMVVRPQKIQWELGGKTLSVRSGRPAGLMGCVAAGERHLEVIIPRSTADDLLTVKVAGASGSYDLSGLTCKTLTLDVASGSVKVADVRADALNLGVASGRVDVAGVFPQSVRADVASGNVRVTCEQAMPGGARISVASGQVTCALPDEGGFTAAVDVASGSFSCGFDAQQRGGAYVYGDGRARFDVSIMSGRVALTAS